ncbi:MAG TPA: Lrp/AsnC ligand binding domain-containing protein [Actinomycetota bacterium]|nr:Lrp/AsnC ligand binding domain-containing protein [Actinomycetota bacterium]
MDAFVYVAVRPGRLEDVVVRLENANGVRAAVAVVGDWDVLVAVHGADLLSIAQDVIRHIHRIDGIERTLTAPVVPGDVLGLAGGGLRTSVPMQQHGDACFVHVKAAPGMAARLVESLADLEDVSAVALIAGEYDLIVEIPYSWEHAARVIVDQVLALPGVAATRTLVAIPALEPADEDRDQFSAWS